MSEIAVLTELDAVNQILDAIDEAPVSSLGSGLPDAEKAERFLERYRRQILAKGWNSNRERETTLSRDVNNEILIGNDVLRVKASGTSKGTKVSVRVDANVRKLYDIKNRTFTWTQDIVADVIYQYPFAELEPELQHYIAAVAAQKYQESSMGSVALDSFVSRNVAEAWAALQDMEAEGESDNVLTDSPHCWWISQRNNRLYGS